MPQPSIDTAEIERVVRAWIDTVERHGDAAPDRASAIKVTSDLGFPNLPAAARRLARGVTLGLIDRETALKFPRVKGPLANEPVSAQVGAQDRDPAKPRASGEIVELEKARREIARLKAERDELARSAADKSAFDEILANVTAAPCSPPDLFAAYHTAGRGAGAQVPFLLSGDWHLGEVVNAGQSGGYSYNSTIAEKRIAATVDKFLAVCDSQENSNGYPGAVVCMLGDLVSGKLHPELAESDEYEILPSIMRARDLAVSMLDAIAHHFDTLFVPCAVGNHGRVFDRKPRAKGYAERNADWLIYELLKDHYRGNDKICIATAETGEVGFEIMGHRFLATHGDRLGAKGGDGIIGAIGPIMRGTLKTSASLASMGEPFDTALMGHWHQPLWLQGAIVNGALKGPDEYASRMLRAVANPASQSAFILHQHHGIKRREELTFDDEGVPDEAEAPAPHEGAPWVSVGRH